MTWLQPTTAYHGEQKSDNKRLANKGITRAEGQKLALDKFRPEVRQFLTVRKINCWNRVMVDSFNQDWIFLKDICCSWTTASSLEKGLINRSSMAWVAMQGVRWDGPFKP